VLKCWLQCWRNKAHGRHRLVERPPGGQRKRVQNTAAARCGGCSAGSAELVPETSHRVECGHAPGGMDAGI